MSKKLSNKHLWLPVSILCMVLFFLYLSVCVMDNDGYFILASGRYITAMHSVPKYNPFTFTSGMQIVVQQWAWCAISYLLYSKFAKFGLFGLLVIVDLLILFLYVKIAKLNEVSLQKAILAGSIFLLPFVFYNSIRPTMVTMLLILWQIYVVEAYRKDWDARRLILLPVISILEINFHAAVWVMHFVFLLPYLVPAIKNPFVSLEEDYMDRKRLILPILGMVAGGFVNPYGLDGILYLTHSYGDELKSAEILELNPPSFGNLGILAIPLTVFVIVWITKKRKTEIDSAHFYLFCGTVIMGCMHVRNLAYLFLGILIFSIEMSKYWKSKLTEKCNKHTMEALSMAALAVCIAATIGINGNLQQKGKDNSFTPVKAIKYLDSLDEKPERIMTGFNNGGYFEWKGYKIFVDARPELYFKELNKKQDLFKDYLTLRNTSSVSKVQRILDKYDFEYLMVSDSDALKIYLDSTNRYEVAMSGNGYQLYKKNDTIMAEE